MPLPPTFPELAALDLFASVVTLGSVSRAAAAHGITQPSASWRMRTLERQLGLPLLERSPTGSVPTPAGHLVAGWVEALLHAADELATGVDALVAESGTIRVAASYTVAEHLLPGWLGRFARAHPGHPVELEVADSAEVVARTRAGDCDLGFVESPGPVGDLAAEVVGADELVVVVGPGHPWARRRALTVEDVAGAALVLRETGDGTRDAFDRAIAAAGWGPSVAAREAGTTAAVKNAVVGSGLPGVLSRLAVADDEAAGRLVALPVDGLDLGCELRAVHRADRALGAAAADLLAVVRDDVGTGSRAGPTG